MLSGEAKRVMCFDGMLSLFCHLFRHGQHTFMSKAVIKVAFSLVAFFLIAPLQWEDIFI